MLTNHSDHRKLTTIVQYVLYTVLYWYHFSAQFYVTDGSSSAIALQIDELYAQYRLDPMHDLIPGIYVFFLPFFVRPQCRWIR